ncbi:hypothetical protein IJ818_02170, partial [bacterium]|nr:hypothetical protein [bacterium]
TSATDSDAACKCYNNSNYWLGGSTCCSSENTSDCCTSSNTSANDTHKLSGTWVESGSHGATTNTCCKYETTSDVCCKAKNDDNYWLGGSTCCSNENTSDCCQSDNNPNGSGEWISDTNTCRHAYASACSGWLDAGGSCCTEDNSSGCCTSSNNPSGAGTWLSNHMYGATTDTCCHIATSSDACCKALNTGQYSLSGGACAIPENNEFNGKTVVTMKNGSTTELGSVTASFTINYGESKSINAEFVANGPTSPCNGYCDFTGWTLDSKCTGLTIDSAAAQSTSVTSMCSSGTCNCTVTAHACQTTSYMFSVKSGAGVNLLNSTNLDDVYHTISSCSTQSLRLCKGTTKYIAGQYNHTGGITTSGSTCTATLITPGPPGTAPIFMVLNSGDYKTTCNFTTDGGTCSSTSTTNGNKCASIADATPNYIGLYEEFDDTEISSNTVSLKLCRNENCSYTEVQLSPHADHCEHRATGGLAPDGNYVYSLIATGNTSQIKCASGKYPKVSRLKGNCYFDGNATSTILWPGHSIGINIGTTGCELMWKCQ